MDRGEAKRPEGPHTKLSQVGKLVTALDDFTATAEDELSFKKGDKMKLLDGSEGDYLMARHLRSGCVGLIPWTFIQASEESNESEEWFFRVSSEEAEQLLLARAHPRGTFLVRPSSSPRHNPFTLSLKDAGTSLAEHQVRHFKIRKIGNGVGYYIILGEPFQNVHDLILYYKGTSLCDGSRLTQVCPRPETVAPKPYVEEEKLVQKQSAPSITSVEPSVISREGEIVVALFDYQAQTREDVSFVKGDKMEIIDNSEDYWMTVSHLGSRHQGLIPSNYVAFEDTIESEDWFFKIGRREAETLLQVHKNIRGTFLVRFRGSDVGNNSSAFSLSVKGGKNVYHYKIVSLDDRSYFVSEHQRFTTVQDLVLYYKNNEIISGCILNIPCPKPKPQMWDLSPELRNQWELDRNDIKMTKKLGQGNFGEVYFGTWKGNTKIAVKKLKAGPHTTQQDFLKEAAIMKKFRHERLVALYGVCTKHEPMLIVTEFMRHGALDSFLQAKADGRAAGQNFGRNINDLTFEDLVYFAEQIASGMQYMEKMKTIHRDLAARNVLVGDNNVVKICDFGMARIIDFDKYYCQNGTVKPLKWTAPEALFFNKYTIQSDVWSYGIVLMEIFTMGQPPYPEIRDRNILMQEIKRGYRMLKPAHVQHNVYQLMCECWQLEPNNRPSFHTILKKIRIISA